MKKQKEVGTASTRKKHSLQFTTHVRIINSIERSPFCCIAKQLPVAGGDHWPNKWYQSHGMPSPVTGAEHGHGEHTGGITHARAQV
jgi:hypothetical protein